MPDVSIGELERVYDGEGDVETVTFESVCYPISFRIDAAAPSPIVICDCYGQELGRAASPFHAALFVSGLRNAYGPHVRSLPAALMRELRSVRPELVR